MRGIGVMSGTSVDSIDLAYVEIRSEPNLGPQQASIPYKSLDEYKQNVAISVIYLTIKMTNLCHILE